MNLDSIVRVEATLTLASALHIGAGNAPLGGDALPTVRAGIDDLPYIPGSSIKGRMRALLSESLGAGEDLALQLAITVLFGRSGSRGALSFWDCQMDQEWVAHRRSAGLALSGLRSEQFPRNDEASRSKPYRSAAPNADPSQPRPRQESLFKVRRREREIVPEGTPFIFRATLSLRVSDRLDLLLAGMKLFEWEGLGSSTSRGMGRVRFEALRIDGKRSQDRLDAVGLETVEATGGLAGA